MRDFFVSPTVGTQGRWTLLTGLARTKIDQKMRCGNSRWHFVNLGTYGIFFVARGERLQKFRFSENVFVYSGCTTAICGLDPRSSRSLGESPRSSLSSYCCWFAVRSSYFCVVARWVRSGWVLSLIFRRRHTILIERSRRWEEHCSNSIAKSGWREQDEGQIALAVRIPINYILVTLPE